MGRWRSTNDNIGVHIMTGIAIYGGGLFLNTSSIPLVMTNGQPCCCSPCPIYSCLPQTISFCDCVGDSATICCYKTTGSVAVTFSTITPADGYESLPYADVIDDLIDKVSGKTIDFYFSDSNISQSFTKYGKVSKIQDCVAYAWSININSSFNISTLELEYRASISINGTNVGYPFSIGSPFPCTDENGVATGLFGSGGGRTFIFTDIAASSSYTNGDCCGPLSNMELTALESSYIDDESIIEISPFVMTTDCNECDESGFPSTVDFDLSQCYSGLPVVSFNKTSGIGLVGLDYELSASGTVGDIRYDAWGLIIPDSIVLDPDEGCTTKIGCCFAIQYYIEVWDETDTENPILLLTCEDTGYKCGDKNTVVGTYNLITSGTVEVISS
jgi:hypothetical protein